MTISNVNRRLSGDLSSDRILKAFRRIHLESFSLIALLATVLLISSTGLCQSGGGRIAGSVTDTSGAVITGAAISAVNEKSGSTYSAVTSSAGEFHFPTMQVGTYTVTVTAQGFQAGKNTGVLVETDKTAALDVILKPGSTEQTITVSTDALRIETESVDNSTIVSPQLALDLPLTVGSGAMRNAGDFVFITPATVGSTGSTGGVWFDRVGAGQSDGSEVLLDGLTVVSPDFGDASTSELLPSLDAVEEFNVSIAGISPQYGRTTGAVQSYTTKSGTNEFHGSAYEINRNTAFDANQWFNNANGVPRNTDQRNEFGLTFGGPVWIPHVYDGHNKTFGFFSWEQFQQNQSSALTETVPTAANRNGDFTSTLGTTPLGVDPCGQTIYPGEIFDSTTSLAGTGGTTCRAPLTYNGQMNMINPASFSSVAKKALSYVPAPRNNNLLNNYIYQSSEPLRDTAETIRLDQAFSTRDKLFVSYNAREDVRVRVNADFPAPISSTSSSQDFFNHQIRIGDTHAFGPKVVNQATLGYQRTWNYVIFDGGSTKYDSTLGISGINGAGFPYFVVSGIGQIGYDGVQPWGIYEGPLLWVNNSFDFTDAASATYGKHSFTIGADLRFFQFSVIKKDSPGAFVFSRGETADTVAEINNTGNGMASYLLGDLQAEAYNSSIRQVKALNNYTAIYAQDSYKVSPSLQLMLGVRYDVDVPWREAANDRSNFSPTAPNPGAGGIPGAIIFAGSGAGRSGLSSRFANTWFKDIAPRVGLTYSPAAFHQKTVLRASFSTLYGPEMADDSGYSTGPGFSPQAFLSDSSSGGYISPINMDSPFTPLPTTINFDPSQMNGGSPMATLRSFGRPAAIQLWSSDVEHQFASNLLLTFSYVGSRSTHLHSNIMFMNNITPSYYSLGTALTNTATTNLPYAGFSGTVAQSLRPFPQFSSFDTADAMENLGQGSFNAFITKLERRFQNGFSMLASYTWSKQQTDADSYAIGVLSGAAIQNPFDLKSEKSVSIFDVPHAVNINYLYELPFGHGKRFLSSGAALNELVGGWEIGGIHRYHEGQPFSVACASSIPGNDACVRYNFVPGQSLLSTAARSGHFNPLTDVYLNINALTDLNANIATTGGAYRLGNVPRVLSGRAGARLPPFYDEDFSIIKRFSIVHESSFELRADLFNAFNRHSWGAPNYNPASGPSGFGQITYTSSTARQIQFEGRIRF